MHATTTRLCLLLGRSGQGHVREAIQHTVVHEDWVDIRANWGGGVLLLQRLPFPLHHLLLLHHLLSFLRHLFTLSPFLTLLRPERCFHSIPV